MAHEWPGQRLFKMARQGIHWHQFRVACEKWEVGSSRFGRHVGKERRESRVQSQARAEVRVSPSKFPVTPGPSPEGEGCRSALTLPCHVRRRVAAASVPRVARCEIVAFGSGCDFLACNELSARRSRRWGRTENTLHSVPDLVGRCIGVLLQLILLSPRSRRSSFEWSNFLQVRHDFVSGNRRQGFES
jgi:hypothetical protein